MVVPLKLSWNPTYSTDDQGICIGDRVKVRVTGHLHDAVVIATDIIPDIDLSRVQPIEGVANGLERITPGEIELWKFISSYYLCTLGEVYKNAYPSGKIQGEEHAAEMSERRNAIAQRRADEAEAKRLRQMERLRVRISAKEADLEKRHSPEVMARLKGELEALRLKLSQEEGGGRRTAMCTVPDSTGISDSALFDGATYRDCDMQGQLRPQLDAIRQYGTRPVLIEGSPARREELYLAAAAEMLGKGKSVLYLCPEMSQSKTAEAAARMSGIADERILSFRSSDTQAHRRKVTEALRAGGAHIIFGTRAALFLPFGELGLVIIDEEQDISYKQDSPAPRYNCRDTAVMLASIHHASTILGSATPSLESLHNAHCGRYGHIMAGNGESREINVEVIDTAAEKRKNGMVGQISRKLIDAVRETEAYGGKAMVITTWNDKTGLVTDASTTIPDAAVFNMREARNVEFGDYSLVALVQADTLLGGEDFRTDEKALQLLDRFRHRCSGNRGRFIVQTSKSDHQVFRGIQEICETGASAYELLLPEREMFGFPPFSRIVDAVIRDERPKRLEFMSTKLMEAMYAELRPGLGAGAPIQVTGPVVPESWKEDALTRRTVRIIIKRDARLPSRKECIQSCVSRFEKDMKYTGHITIDVDPQ